jgi:3-oxoacyl-[acyl-carrier protein] reductase
MLLEGKNAVIYGGGGSIGGAVARAFAREGASVFLAGRTIATLDGVAGQIRSAGGMAETAQVDALDGQAVDEHTDAVAARAGSIDISFNLISHGDVQGGPLAEMSLEDFERPVVTAVRTMFLTSRAAARHMIEQGSGVILVFGGYGDATPDYYLGGLQVAFQAMESLRRQFGLRARSARRPRRDPADCGGARLDPRGFRRAPDHNRRCCRADHAQARGDARGCR